MRTPAADVLVLNPVDPYLTFTDPGSD